MIDDDEFKAKIKRISKKLEGCEICQETVKYITITEFRKFVKIRFKHYCTALGGRVLVELDYDRPKGTIPQPKRFSLGDE